ncbi:protein artichoke-like isoform X2 [Pectinophora gossypiella]|uniref:protein artichoke-like isoform X2 n=1 Tax=Pectinophora gossypiella TaxID=13191 RepID=UPI00214F1470|nr:protein artichoke-like isoform X2 [Pectinophora gossypiella]
MVLRICGTVNGRSVVMSRLPANPLVETLRFSNNAIKTYWPDPFSEVSNLKKLSFSQNDLTEITPDLFTNIEHLEDLDLSYNKLTEFNPLDFKHLRNVRRFNLQSNQLKKVPLEALQPMLALEDLDLSKNGIYDLLLQRGDTVVLKDLKRLNLSGNRVRSVMRNSFSEDNSLELLDLSNNIIEIIEEDAFMGCTNLRELNLGQNNITVTFALPPSLQIAILKINTLYHWPQFPSGITYIDLSYNKLTDLYDESKAEFDNLEILNIGGNQIKDLTIEKKLPKLFTLDLSYNLFVEVPKSINSELLPTLEELRLDGNPIESIYFKNIIALKHLYMSELLKLEVVDDKSFSNVIGRSGEDASQNSENCFFLYLSNCPALREIKEGAFAGTNVCMLDISKNNLTGLSKNLLDWGLMTEGANLQFNPWQCSCELQWVLDDLLPMMYSSNSRLLAELRCGSPRAFEGLRLVHFYNWTEQAMCNDAYSPSGSRGNYMLEPSTDPPKVTSLTLILGGCIIVALLVAIALSVYLVKSRRRYRVRQAAMKRKRQSALDAKNSNGMQKEQFSALNSA